jgi:hypothetical protein
MSAQTLAANATGSQLPIPSAQTLILAAKLAQQQDKPLMLDYYADSVLKKAFLGIDKETGDKILLKNRDEFTSLIKKVNRTGPNETDDLLVQTENSIYIVTGAIDKKHIAATKLLAESDEF